MCRDEVLQLPVLALAVLYTALVQVTLVGLLGNNNEYH